MKKDNEEGSKITGKTSIMTTSTGKTLKRKHEDDAVVTDTDISEFVSPEKKITIDKLIASSEISISKASDDKTNGKELEPQLKTLA